MTTANLPAIRARRPAWNKNRVVGQKRLPLPKHVWRLACEWVKSIGLDPTSYGTHSMRRTKVAHIYRKTGNLRAVQLLLGHTKMDSTVRYLGVELEDALTIAEAVEI
jgi:integrase